jgi:hypothetical protein
VRELTYQITIANQQAVAALREVDRSMEQVAAQAKETGQAVDRATDQNAKSLSIYDQNAKASYERRAAWSKQTAADLIKEGEAAKQAGATVQQTATKTDGALASLGRRIVAVFAVERLVSFGKQVVDNAGKIADLSAKTGLSTTAIQKFGYAAALSGGTIDQVANAIALMSKNLVGGGAGAVEALNRLGLSHKALMQMDPETAFLQIATAIKNLNDPMLQADAAMRIFGKGGKELLPAIKAGFEEAGDEAERLGVIMSEQTVQDLDELGDTWTKVWAGMQGWAARVLVTVLEVGRAMAGLASLAPDWLKTIGGTAGNIAAAPFTLTGAAFDQWRAQKAAWDWASGKTPDPAKGPASMRTNGAWTPSSLDDLLEIDVPEPVIERTTRLAKAKTEAATATIRLTAAQRDGMQGFAEYAGEVQLAAMYMQQLAAATQIATIAPNYPSINSMMLPDAVTSTFRGGTGMVPGAAVRDPRMTWQNGIPQFGSWDGTAGNIANGAMVGMGTAEGIGGLMADTDVAGRGNRAWAGAKRGAQVGAMFGPYGALIGMGVGALVGALRNPGFEQEMKRISRNFGVDISEQLARSIDTLRKDFRGDRQAAEIFSIGNIIQEAGGITDENVTRLTARLRDTFVMLDMGKFSTAQATQVLDESFGYFAEHLAKAGGLASKQFLELLALNARFGTESRAITDFIRGQVDDASEGLQTYLENATVTSAEAAVGVTAAVGLLFAELRDQGLSVMEIFDQLGPSIDMLAADLTAAGIDGGAAFQAIADLAAYAADEAVQRASAAVDGLSQLMKGLHNAGMMTEETFKGLARATTDVYQQLEEAGKGGENAWKVMQPGLQQLWEMQKRYGWAVDESTQHLLDQAEAAGIIGAAFADSSEVMKELLTDIKGLLTDIRDGFFGVGDAAEAAAQQATAAFEGMPSPGGGNGGEYYAHGGVVYAANGWPRPRGTDTVPAMLTPGEGVLSRRGMAALGALNHGRLGGGGGGISVTVDLRGATVLEDDPAVARRLADVVERELTARITRERKYSAVLA